MKRMTILSLMCLLAVVAFRQTEAAVLTHRYSFDVDANDSAGTNHGTLTNGASIVVDAERGGVLQLDGVDDYVSLGGSNIPGGPTDTATFTIAAWLKIPSGDVAFGNIAGPYGEFTSFRHPDTGFTGVKNFLVVRGISHGVNNSGEVSYEQTPPGGSNISSTSTINDGQWHHIAYVQNESGGPSRKLYVDGVLDASDTTPEVYGGLDPDLWAIGARLDVGSERYFQGHLDDIRFYDGALGSSEIADLTVIPGPLPGDINFDGICSVDDIDELSSAIRQRLMDQIHDVNNNGSVNSFDRAFWVTEIKKTFFGDANLDGEFNSSDLIQILQAGEYTDGIPGNSTWGEGDFGGDGEFDTDDLILALQTGAYEQGPQAAVPIPEPNAIGLLVIGFLVLRPRLTGNNY